MLFSTKKLKWISLHILLCFTFPSFGEWEYGADAIYRSYPLSASLNGRLGYGYKFWGGSSASSTMYGFIKPEIFYSTAGTYNAGMVQFKFFPISFLGATAGGEAISNHDRYRAYDCETYNCQGKFSRTFIEGALALGWKAWFAIGRAGIEDWQQGGGQSKDFVNPAYGLVLQADGDRLKYVTGATGLKLGDNWTLAYSYRWAQAEKVEGQSQAHLGLLEYKWGQFKFAAGGGTFQSEMKDKEATFIVRAAWAPTASVELF